MSLKLQNDRKAATGFRRWFSKTLIAAYVVLGLVLWQTIHVVGGGEMPFTSSGKPQMGSTKLHLDRDATSRKNRPTKEPVAAFFDRAKRGMTEQEIRGMIADFEAIETKPNWLSLEECRAHVEKQNDWYATALGEALSLSSEQRQTVRASLTENLNQTLQGLVAEDLLEVDHLIGVIRHKIFEPTIYYLDSNDSNQNLLYFCDLTADQFKLTYKQAQQMKAEHAKNNPKPFNLEQPRYNYRSMSMHDVVTGDFVDYPPPSNYDLRCTLHGTLRGGVIDVTNTFPLTPDQKLADHRDDLLAQAKLLHPAQLRMALLMNPGVFQSLKHQLDKPQE